MRSLAELLSAITVEEIIGVEDKPINSLQSDSRRVSRGDLFVAVRGVNVDASSTTAITSDSQTLSWLRMWLLRC